MSAITIFMPCAANALAWPSATPLPPPVMNATLPARSFMTTTPNPMAGFQHAAAAPDPINREGNTHRAHERLARMDPANDIREALREQAQWCRKLGSPFTALLCDTLAQHLRPDGAVAREILE